MRQLWRLVMSIKVRTACAWTALAMVCAVAQGDDWVHWRGPKQCGVSSDTGLPDKFSPDPGAANNNLIWVQPYGCRSTPVVMNDRVYFIGSAGEGLNEGERVVCLDASTGSKIWEDKFNVFHTDIVSNRL